MKFPLLHCLVFFIVLVRGFSSRLDATDQLRVIGLLRISTSLCCSRKYSQISYKQHC